MSTLTDTASFTANEVYEIQSTDAVEGASSNASFGGIGLSNQPHQQLANRTAFIKGRQDTNISNISALQTFQGFFTGLMGANGYLKIPFVDTSRGAIVGILEWGSYFPSGGLVADGDFTVTWPLQFPNACFWVLASLSNSADNNQAGVVVMETVRFTATQGTFKSDYNGAATAGQAHDNDGFYWLAIGF